MDNVLLITDALGYIEANLTEDLRTDDIAKELYCSKSSVEKLFRFVTNMTIKDYSIRRRMSKAAKDLVENPEKSLLDVAITYGYSSNEAFTRAFKSVWHATPSEYRKNPVRFELFPPIMLEPELMECDKMDTRRKFDISELYDLIKERRECYIVGADIKGLIPINNISRELGDVAILTALNRLEAAAGEDSIVFRVGGDEFVAITDSKDKAVAEAIVEKMISHNGEIIRCGENEYPLELYGVCYQLEKKNLRYAELFTELQERIINVKEAQELNK